MLERENGLIHVAFNEYATNGKLKELAKLKDKCKREILSVEIYLTDLHNNFFKKTKALAYGYIPSHKVELNSSKTAVIQEYVLPVDNFKYKNQLVSDDFLGNSKNICAFMAKEFARAFKKNRTYNEEYEFSCNSSNVCSIKVVQREDNLCIKALDGVFDCAPCIVDGREYIKFTFIYSLECNV